MCIRDRPVHGLRVMPGRRPTLRGGLVKMTSGATMDLLTRRHRWQMGGSRRFGDGWTGAPDGSLARALGRG
eukprot:15189634-Alexandrium_andersonii.AAC.1